jgi:hypothetical protein
MNDIVRQILTIQRDEVERDLHTHRAGLQAERERLDLMTARVDRMEQTLVALNEALAGE